MKLQSFLLVFAVCMSAEAADEMSLMKFKATNSCEGCDLSNANFSDADLTNVDLSSADIKGINLDNAKFCKTTTPWGEDNSGC